MAVKYLCDEFAGVTFTRRPCRPYGQNPQGYGRKIATGRIAKIGNRWHRVYCICFSNVGSPYVIKNGEAYYIRDFEIDP